ncbi:MAG: tRNA (N6-isopentenyl adenosine(37)-C2)-methylthiotransferase MiaB [SAR202 cluster bacterium Io17-Chloro-G9]|nr:MAG: tRNA (N6-isopentenyl adenosine(37)-C2)-methylthiotransferase MiaB [SAR202 cluster bacterium Io17-Chloro-G9]
MESFHLWTIGCQMNKADSQRLESALEQLGLRSVDQASDADLIVLNSCVVRQQAEDKVVGNLTSMQPLKKQRPDRVVALMGCMVGAKTDELARRFPYVDVFMRPQEYGPLLDLVGERLGLDWEGCVGSLAPSQPSVTCYVPIIHGCDLMCTFCIIPYRRGRQVSRPVAEVVEEVELLAARGVKEVTVLGQTVDAYGHDLPEKPDLADLLTCLNGVGGLERIRFLTSHPSFLSDNIIRAVAELPKVCEHINLPVQAGDDEVLRRMRRPYTRDEYVELVGRIRDNIPGASLSTDIIVGFPGETKEQYQRSLDLVSELRPDKVHCAAYSQRPGTIAGRTMEDDVPADEKVRRRVELEQLQEAILTETNRNMVGQKIDILVEGQRKGKWEGRTRSNKLVYFQSERDHLGQLVNLDITRATPWSLQGELVQV